MILKELIKTLGKTGKTLTDSVKSSLKFMDEVLEKEYIVGSIDEIKEATGKVVEKSGELYQRTKDNLEELSDSFEQRFEEE